MSPNAIPFPTLVRVDPELFALWKGAAAQANGEKSLGAFLHRNREGIEVQTRSEARAVIHGIRDLMTRGEFLLWRPVLSQIATEVARLLPAETEGAAPKSYAALGHSPAVFPAPNPGMPASSRLRPESSPSPPPSSSLPATPPAVVNARAAWSDYFAPLGRRLGLRVLIPRQNPSAADIPLGFAGFDLLWMDADGVVSAFLLGLNRGVLDTLLTLADAASISPLRGRLYLVGDESDRAVLAAALQRPSFQALRTRESFAFLTVAGVQQRLSPIDDLIEFLSPEFLSRLSSEL